MYIHRFTFISACTQSPSSSQSEPTKHTQTNTNTTSYQWIDGNYSCKSWRRLNEFKISSTTVADIGAYFSILCLHVYVCVCDGVAAWMRNNHAKIGNLSFTRCLSIALSTRERARARERESSTKELVSHAAIKHGFLPIYSRHCIRSSSIDTFSHWQVNASAATNCNTFGLHTKGSIKCILHLVIWSKLFFLFSTPLSVCVAQRTSMCIIICLPVFELFTGAITSYVPTQMCDVHK